MKTGVYAGSALRPQTDRSRVFISISVNEGVYSAERSSKKDSRKEYSGDRSLSEKEERTQQQSIIRFLTKIANLHRVVILSFNKYT